MEEEIVEARTFTADKESEFWDWLGDAYLASSDYTESDESGPSETSVTIEVQTPDGQKTVNEGDVILKKSNGFYVLTPKEAEEQLKDVPSEMFN